MIAMQPLTAADDELRNVASLLLSRTHDAAQHRVAAAVRGGSGAIYVGLSLKSPRVDVCAEPSAIANARIGGEDEITTIVAVGLGPDDVPLVINPCGMCRELVPHYAPKARLIVASGTTLGVVSVEELLPMPWVRARAYD